MATERRQPTRPPFDPELEAVLRANPALSRPVLPEHIEPMRALRADPSLRLSDAALEHHGRIRFTELTVPVDESGTQRRLLVLRPSVTEGPARGVFYVHGGGMVFGDERSGVERLFDWVTELGLVVLSPDYRLAPEHPDPVPVQDCYGALCWVSDHAEELGLAAGGLVVAGTSAGGGLAAGVTLLARDRGTPAISDQILMCPMLDDRDSTPSSHELDGEGVWDRRSNLTGWGALLGERRGGPDVSPYAAPARAEDLAGLPPAYLDVGAVETFRDEVIDYAARLAGAGVSVELHMWAGGFHGFDVFAPTSRLSVAAQAARLDYLRRRMAPAT